MIPEAPVSFAGRPLTIPERLQVAEETIDALVGDLEEKSVQLERLERRLRALEAGVRLSGELVQAAA